MFTKKGWFYRLVKNLFREHPVNLICKNFINIICTCRWSITESFSHKLYTKCSRRLHHFVYNLLDYTIYCDHLITCWPPRTCLMTDATELSRSGDENNHKKYQVKIYCWKYLPRIKNYLMTLRQRKWEKIPEDQNEMMAWKFDHSFICF